ncbi:MAG: S41 family peptidase [Chlamydiales bacterium]|nr:S41 family peptidase [Chlamydiales bacterium]
MNANFDFKFSQPGGTQPNEFEFNLSKSDHVEQKSQIKVGEQFYSIIPKNPEDLGAIKGLLKKSIRENKIQTIEDLKRNITSISSSASTTTSDITTLGVATLAVGPTKSEYQVNLQNLNRVKEQTIHSIAGAMVKRYVFEDKGIECATHLKKLLQEGAYDAISDPKVFAEMLTKDLISITKDKHILVGFKAQARAPVAIADKVDYSVGKPQLKDENKDDIKAYIAPTNEGWCGMQMGSIPYEYKAGFLKEDPSIGYFDLLKFGVCDLRIQEGADAPSLEDVTARREAFKKGIEHVKGAKAIIIDMRDNSGGDPFAVQLLCSLFMKEEIPLNRIEWRTTEGPKSEDFHTLTYDELPSNERLLDTHLYILDGPWTFSAGEEFANNMKVNGRATIVGEPTGGGANPCRMHDVNDLFEMQIPTGRAVNPKQEGNWEGVGIIPDHFVPAEKALDEAVRLIHASKK